MPRLHGPSGERQDPGGAAAVAAEVHVRVTRPLMGTKWLVVFTLALAALPAIVKHQPYTALVLALTILPIIPFAFGEWLVSRRGQAGGSSSTNPALLRLVTGVCVALAVAGAWLTFSSGAGAVDEVVTGYEYSTVGTLARGLSQFIGIAVAFLVLAELKGAMQRRTVLILCAGLLGAQTVASISLGYLSLLLGPGIAFVVLGSMSGLIGFRRIAVVLAVLAVLLPTLFQLRDDVRESLGMERSSEVVGPYERFAVDEQIALIGSAPPSSLFDTPSPLLVIRTALIPRVLDADRPVIDLGRQMYYAQGGRGASNSSFGHFGTIFWLYGAFGVVVAAFLLGLVFGVGFRKFQSVTGVLLVAAIARPAVWPSATFPSYIAGAVQFVLLGLIVYAACWLVLQPVARQRARVPARSVGVAAHVRT